LLHRVALGSNRMGRLWFDLEQSKASRTPGPAIEKPVFISGMARSGSTILLNALYDTGLFRSLTYRDMPFILMTGTWKGLSGGSRVESEKTERAHGDRLLVDLDSPEAFEEVFWRTFHGARYIQDDRVIAHEIPASELDSFREFVRHVLLSRDSDTQTRYLSKNNNNLLRLGSIRQAFPDALLLLPFREPLQQALSLQRQHNLFLERHAQDKFGMNYMNWLGHFEFGLGHKQYIYGEGENPYEPETLDYWLHCWGDAYEYALQSAPPDTVFLGYEQMCETPLEGFTRLYSLLGIEADPAVAADFYSGADRRDAQGCDTALHERCLAVHQRLVERHTAATR
jgi:hypothetical protein